MRIKRLDLIRYGHFSDRSLELPSGKPDLHVVVGPNETGKSTALSAVADLLFGIPTKSPFNFLHDYGEMRIGAALEADSEVLEVRRRKGIKGTLLSTDDRAIPSGEHALRPFLRGAGRNFFERMFGLDHARLRAGGREILQGDGDDAGQQIFGASSGIQGLQSRLKLLDDEATQLWTNRRSGTRKYYIADDRLKEADRQRRDHTVSTDKWLDLRRTFARCQEDLDRLQQQIRETGSELRKIGRIRRVARNVAKRSTLANQINALGEIVEFEAGTAQRLREAENERRDATLLLEQARSELDKTRAERTAIHWDEKLLGRKTEIGSLHNRRISVSKGIADLPELRRRLLEQQHSLVARALEVGWDELGADAIAARVPRSSKLTTLRTALTEWDRQRTQVGAAQASAHEATSRLQGIRDDLANVGTSKDTENLKALIEATKRQYGGIAAQIATEQAKATESAADARRLYSAMDPQPASIEEAVSLTTPSELDVQGWRDRRRDLDKQLDTHHEQRAGARKELASASEYVEQLVAEAKPVTLEDLLEAREARDSLWAQLRDGLINGASLSAGDQFAAAAHPRQLAEEYQQAVKNADQVGDLRVDSAEANARVAEAKRRVVEIKSRLAGIETELARLEENDRQLAAEWSDLWKTIPFEPLGAEKMRTWLATHGELADAVSSSDKHERSLAALRDQEAQALRKLTTELEGLGEDCSGLGQQSLTTVLERAGGVQAENEQTTESRKRLERDLRHAERDEAEKLSRVARESSELEQLEDQWAALSADLGLDRESSALERAHMVDALDEMNRELGSIRDLQANRIEKIERDKRRFSAEVTALARALVPNLVELDPVEAMVEIERRLRDAEQAKEGASRKDEEIKELERDIHAQSRNLQKAESLIESLQAQAGAGDIEGLWAAIKKADDKRTMKDSVEELTNAILKDGDEHPLEKLEQECSEVDMDETRDREDDLQSSIDQLRKDEDEARDRLREARRAFESVGGEEAAAVAEGARQGALAEIHEVAERFVQARAAACLLRWAVERYRKERQGPMLARAGELFSRLTIGSFTHLDLEFDDQDQAQIVGCRQGGARVPTHGMSDGSADQLYLALRVAALESYLEQSPQLPFLADDLFINFDDQRSAAGFEVLASLAGRCQVIFFTHHDHLATLAQQSLGFPVHVLRL